MARWRMHAPAAFEIQCPVAGAMEAMGMTAQLVMHAPLHYGPYRCLLISSKSSACSVKVTTNRRSSAPWSAAAPDTLKGTSAMPRPAMRDGQT